VDKVQGSDKLLRELVKVVNSLAKGMQRRLGEDLPDQQHLVAA
jgi:hypothetical protein